jgi:hypothetical protein
LIKFRKENPTLALRNDNKTKSIQFSDDQKMLSFIRFDKKNQYLIICNNTSETIQNPSLNYKNIKNTKYDLKVITMNNCEVGDINVNYNNNTLKINKLTLKPYSYILLKLK